MRFFCALRGALLLFAAAHAYAADARAADEPPCRPFRVHAAADLPPPPPPFEPAVGAASGTEADLVTAIARAGGGSEFPAAYERWLAERPRPADAAERRDLLQCIKHYATMDLDGDGVADWTPVVDRRLTTVLAPRDDDMDGDGIPNVLDPRPLVTDTKASPRPGELPAHLARVAAPALAPERARLFRRFGIVAVDHTDEHARAVLAELERVLTAGLPRGLASDIGSIQFLYAFAGHDAHHDIAAYHRGLRALSIGGVAAYGSALRLDVAARVRLAASLAHEIGHAFAFDCMTPADLADGARRHGGWGAAPGAPAPDDFFAAELFAPHPTLTAVAADRRLPAFKEMSVASQYALTNAHEWFADAFAAHALRRMGRTLRLGAAWTRAFASPPDADGSYWADYANLSPAAEAWIEARIRDRRCPSRPDFHAMLKD